MMQQHLVTRCVPAVDGDASARPLEVAYSSGQATICGYASVHFGLMPMQKSKGRKYRPQFPKKQPRGGPHRDAATEAPGPSSSLKGYSLPQSVRPEKSQRSAGDAVMPIQPNLAKSKAAVRAGRRDGGSTSEQRKPFRAKPQKDKADVGAMRKDTQSRCQLPCHGIR